MYEHLSTVTKRLSRDVREQYRLRVLYELTMIAVLEVNMQVLDAGSQLHDR